MRPSFVLRRGLAFFPARMKSMHACMHACRVGHSLVTRDYWRRRLLRLGITLLCAFPPPPSDQQQLWSRSVSVQGLGRCVSGTAAVVTWCPSRTRLGRRCNILATFSGEWRGREGERLVPPGSGCSPALPFVLRVAWRALCGQVRSDRRRQGFLQQRPRCGVAPGVGEADSVLLRPGDPRQRSTSPMHDACAARAAPHTGRRPRDGLPCGLHLADATRGGAGGGVGRPAWGQGQVALGSVPGGTWPPCWWRRRRIPGVYG